MIHIQVKRYQDGLEIHAVGHAEYAPRGKDVVCAGVSALLYGFVAYLKTLLSVATAKGEACGGELLQCKGYERDGELWVRTRGEVSRITEGFAVVEAGIRLLAKTYPDRIVVEKIDFTGRRRT